MKTKPSKIFFFFFFFFFEILSPSFTLSYAITKKSKRVNLRPKSHWGSWSSWGSSLITLSLGFIVIRVLFRFLIDRILFRVLSGRIFFFRVRSNRFFSSSMLFFRHIAIFLSDRVTTLIKNRCFWKCQYFQRPIDNPVEHLWWSLYCKNSKP